MKVDERGRTIKAGDRVKITGLGLVTDTGTVLDANWYRDEEGWYIELTWDNDLGYGYWKQGQDGGQVELIMEVEMNLVEKLKQLPEEIGFGNEPTDEFIDPYLSATQLILTWLAEDLEENEPYAKGVISALRDAAEYIPDNMEDTRERLAERKV